MALGYFYNPDQGDGLGLGVKSRFRTPASHAIIAAMTYDSRVADALARLPDYLGSHVLVSITALALGLGVSLPLAIASRQHPVLRAALLGVTSVVQTIPGLAVERGELRAEDIDAAGGRRDQPGRDVEPRGFAAAGRSHDGDEFAVGDVQRGALDRGIGTTAAEAESDRNIAECDDASALL
jgi:hypothetical protein